MKTMKKFGALLLSLVLCMSLCVPAFAASSSTTTGSITISGAIANETYTIYQIFDLTFTSETDDEGVVSSTGESYSYKVSDAWKEFVEGYTFSVTVDEVVSVYSLFSLTDNNYLSPDSLIFTYYDEETESVVTDEVIAAFARAALAYAEEEEIQSVYSVSYEYTTTTDADGEEVITATLNTENENISITNLRRDENGYVIGDLTIDDLSLGYYLVGTSLGSLCMLDSTDPDVVINEKNSTPTISKYVYNTEDGDYEHEDHESNGTDVTYELNVGNIVGAVNLVIHDSQPDELLEDWNTFNPTVTLVDGDERTELILDEDYVIRLTGASDEDDTDCSDPAFEEEYGCTFEIDFTGYDFSNVSASAYIEVIYTATLATEGDIYADDFDEIDNWAEVTFGSASSSTPVEAEVYSFGFEIFKYTGDEIDDYYGTYIITVSAYNDSAAGQTDEMFLCLVEADDSEDGGSITYYAVFSAVEGMENAYNITAWLPAEQVTVNSSGPFTTATYVDEDGNTVDLSYITEPEVDDGTVDYTFYCTIDMPEYDYIVLDELGTAESEDDEAGTRTRVGDTSYALPGAVFALTNADDQTAYFLEETVDLLDENGDSTGLTKHIYLFEGWLSDGEEVPEGYTTELTSDDTGFINIEGLNTGTYTVTETAAPDGYNLLDGSITVTITATYDDETGALLTHTVTYTYDGETGEGVVNVLNNAGSKLPGTGGMGTTLFYIIGAILLCGAAVVLIARRRMNSEAA